MWRRTLQLQTCWFQSWRRWLWRCASTRFTSPCPLVRFPHISHLVQVSSVNLSGIVCSYAFALPVATAPNAIVFGHSSMKTADMMKAGFVMNLICVITLVISINSYAVPLFGLDEFPDWAQAAHPNASLCFPWEKKFKPMQWGSWPWQKWTKVVKLDVSVDTVIVSMCN